MRMRGPNNVGRAVKELCKRIQHCCATLRRFTEQKNVESCWPKSLTGFKLCATTRNNIQHGIQTDGTMLGVVGLQYRVRLHGALQTNFSVRTSKVLRIKSRQKGHLTQKACCFSHVDVFFFCNVFFFNC